MSPYIEYAEREIHPIVAKHFFRNGLPPHASQIKSICRALNTMQARCRPIIPPACMPASLSDSDASTDGCIFRAVFHSSVNAKYLGMRLVCYPTDDIAEAPYVYLKLNGVTVSPRRSTHDNPYYLGPNVKHNVKCASGSGLNSWDRFIIDVSYTISANTLYEVELYKYGHCRISGWAIFEEEASSLVSADTRIDTSYIGVGQPIHDTTQQEIDTLIRAIYNYQQGVVLNVNQMSTGTATPLTLYDGQDLLHFDDNGSWYSRYTSIEYEFPPVGILPGLTGSGKAYQYKYRAWAYAYNHGGDDDYVDFTMTNGGAETISVTIPGGPPDGVYEWLYSSDTAIEENPSTSHKMTVKFRGSSLDAHIKAFGLIRLIE